MNTLEDDIREALEAHATLAQQCAHALVTGSFCPDYAGTLAAEDEDRHVETLHVVQRLRAATEAAVNLAGLVPVHAEAFRRGTASGSLAPSADGFTVSLNGCCRDYDSREAFDLAAWAEHLATALVNPPSIELPPALPISQEIMRDMVAQDISCTSADWILEAFTDGLGAHWFIAENLRSGHDCVICWPAGEDKTAEAHSLLMAWHACSSIESRAHSLH